MATQKQFPVYREKNLQIIFLITMMAVLGVASITPAFPNIAKEFNSPAQSIGLLIIYFTLPAVFLTPVLGVFADRYGRKTILTPSLILFGIAGTLCAFVRNFDILLILRFFQGIGAASLGTLNVTLIGDIFSRKKRAEAMGYNAGILSVSTATYPFIGGLLATIGWYLPFALPIFAIPIAIIVLLKLDNPEPSKKQNLQDYFASVWMGLKNFQAIILFLTSMITFIILYGPYLIYFPFLLEKLFNASPFIIGVMMSCMSAATAVTALNFGRLTNILDKKTLLKISFALYSVSLLMIPLFSNIWGLIIPLAILGFAHGINIPCVQTLLAEIAPIEYRSAFMSVYGMVLRIGQTLGPVLIGYAFIAGGLNYVFYAGGVLSLGMFVLLLVFVERERL